MKYDRQVLFIRTQCDNAIRGLEDVYEDEDLSHDDIFDRLKSKFAKYMQKDVFDVSGKKLGKIIGAVTEFRHIIFFDHPNFVIQCLPPNRYDNLFNRNDVLFLVDNFLKFSKNSENVTIWW